MIMVSPTGARLTKADHPNLPVTVPQIVAAVQDCVAAGANALHLHVRDDAGAHSLDPDRYAEALNALSKALPDLPVQITTESGGLYNTKAQIEVLETVKPAMASIALREAARNAPDAKAMYAVCRRNQTEVQHIVYDEGDAAILRGWQEQGVLGQEESVILVLGRYDQVQPSNPDAIEPLLGALPPVGPVMVCAFGQGEHACLRRAAALGLDVRVGFENAIHSPDGTPWPNVAASVAALCKTIG